MPDWWHSHADNRNNLGNWAVMIHRIIVTVVIISGLILPTAHTYAEQSADMKTAIQAWLDNDDETSLPILSRLAKSGDEDAMLLLGQISARPANFSPYMISLSIKQRNSLLKAEGGLSGVSWLKSVTKQKRLAEALLQITRTNQRLKGTKTLFELGEWGQAMRTLIILMNYGIESDQLRLSTTRKIPDNIYANIHTLLAASTFWGRPVNLKTVGISENSLRLHTVNTITPSTSFFWHVLLGSTAEGQTLGSDTDLFNEIRIMRALTRGGSGFYSEITNANIYWFKKIPDEKELSQWETAFEEATNAVMSSPETIALVDFCHTLCPKFPRQCTKFLYGATGGYFSLMSTQTPLEKLIPSAIFYDSKRFEAELISSSVKDAYRYWEGKNQYDGNACIGQRLLR
jgi:hypothetical protein